MKFHRFVKGLVAGMACAGTLLPTDVVLADQSADESRVEQSRRQKTMVMDVSLTKDGKLLGEVFDAAKQPVKEPMVSVRRERTEVARFKAAEDGTFETGELKPGLYYIVAGTGHGLYRVWSYHTAPPKSLKSVKIVSDESVLRAQNGQDGTAPGAQGLPPGQIAYDESGTAFGQVRIVDNGGLAPLPPGGFLSNVGVFDATLIAAGVAGIAVGAVAIDKANDDDDRPASP